MRNEGGGGNSDLLVSTLFVCLVWLVVTSTICPISVGLLQLPFVRPDSLAGHVARVVMERSRRFLAGLLFILILVFAHG